MHRSSWMFVEWLYELFETSERYWEVRERSSDSCNKYVNKLSTSFPIRKLKFLFSLKLMLLCWVSEICVSVMCLTHWLSQITVKLLSSNYLSCKMQLLTVLVNIIFYLSVKYFAFAIIILFIQLFQANPFLENLI